ncbi:hypothetical protein BDZ45DRAFT_804189 [Acephala macrosclerotiorum]|nr:hypothetical protein BDZ45DRAFT_804189 [Acephala macrosclerotiorum]
MPSALSSLDMVAKDPLSSRIEETDEWDMPTFAFHDLDYIPSGYGGILAPYIETGPGTMRAAAILMRVNMAPLPGLSSTPQVICDLGCGDGEFLIGLLGHINSPQLPLLPPIPPTSGFGIDYNAPLIATAISNATIAHQQANWLVYDFNLDENDLFGQMGKQGVTHVFVYLVPKQLALKTVRTLLTRLCESGVVVCCHKFQPGYLVATRSDVLMDLVVYERSLEMGK